MRVNLVINKNYVDMRGQRNIKNRYSDLATGWRIRGSKPGRGIFSETSRPSLKPPSASYSIGTRVLTRE
jgi:hypothetical protein